MYKHDVAMKYIYIYLLYNIAKIIAINNLCLKQELQLRTSRYSLPYGLHSEAMEIQDLTLFESGDPSWWSGDREKGAKTAEIGRSPARTGVLAGLLLMSCLTRWLWICCCFDVNNLVFIR